jgi:hypothetical protein
MKTIHFQLIADSRFCENIVIEIERLNKSVQKDLNDQNIEYKTNNICMFIDFKDGTQQYRTDYYIQKTKEHTYKKIYSTVNKTYAPHYTVK